MVVPLPRVFLFLAVALAVCFSSGTQAQPSFPPFSDYSILGGAYWNSANVDSSVIPSGNAARTITAWVFLADNSTSQAFWGQNVLSGPCNSNELSLGFTGGSFFGTACNVGAASSPAGSYPVGTWYHVAFTWNNVALAGTVFVNGQPGNSVNWNTPLTTANERVVIGARVVSDSSNINGLIIPWQGVVASVHVYSAVLTQAQILADMNGATPLPTMIKLKAVVKAHWPAVAQVAWRSNTAQSLPIGLPDSTPTPTPTPTVFPIAGTSSTYSPLLASGSNCFADCQGTGGSGSPLTFRSLRFPLGDTSREEETPDSCAQKARAQNYIFFGLQDGGQCFADNQFPSQGLASTFGLKCDMTCNSDHSKPCGGGCASQVYTITTPTPTPTPLTPSYQSLSGQLWEARSVPSQVIPSGNSARTITAWVYLSNTNPEGMFWGQNALSGACNSNELSLGFRVDSGFWATSCNVGAVSSQSVSYKLGAWYHVAFTWNSIAQVATLFVNGQPGSPVNFNTQLTTSNDRVVIGARVVNGLISPWQGVVASVTTYGIVLTKGQIIQDMNGNQPFTPMLALQATAQPTWMIVSP